MIPLSHAIVMAAVAVLFVSGFAFGMVVQSQRKWCDLFDTLTEGYTAPASTPPTERGRKIAAQLRELSRSYHC
jgi:hypothetical protein